MLQFEIDKERVVLKADQLGIKEVADIWKGDKSPNKEKANKLLLYVYYSMDVDSPFNDLPPDQRDETAFRNVYGPQGSLSKKEQEQVQALKDRYEELNDNSSKRLLRTFSDRIDDMRKLLNDTKPEIERIEDDKGKVSYVHNTSIITKMMTELSKIIEQRDDLEDKIIARQAKGKIRGGNKASYLEKSRMKEQKSTLSGGK